MGLSEVATSTNDGVHSDIHPDVGGRGVAIPDYPDITLVDSRGAALDCRPGVREIEVLGGVVETWRSSSRHAYPLCSTALVGGQCHGLPHRRRTRDYNFDCLSLRLRHNAHDRGQYQRRED